MLKSLTFGLVLKETAPEAELAEIVNNLVSTAFPEVASGDLPPKTHSQDWRAGFGVEDAEASLWLLRGKLVVTIHARSMDYCESIRSRLETALRDSRQPFKQPIAVAAKPRAAGVRAVATGL